MPAKPQSAQRERQISGYQAYVVARKTYWRTASVIMACHAYQAIAPDSDTHWFDVSWQPKWWGGKVLTLRECFPLKGGGLT